MKLPISFEQLIILNLQMQGRNTNIVKFIDSWNTFLSRAANWKRKTEVKNVAMFEKLFKKEMVTSSQCFHLW